MSDLSKKILTIQEAAELLDVSTKTLRRWEEKGVLVPHRTAGKHRRYLLEDINAFKNQRKAKVSPIAPVEVLSVLNPTNVQVDSRPLPKPIKKLHSEKGHIDVAFPKIKISRPRLELPKLPSRKYAYRYIGAFVFLGLLGTAIKLVAPSILDNEANDPTKIGAHGDNVLAESVLLQDLEFNVYVPTNLRNDVNIEGDFISIGDGTPTNIDLEGGDTFVTGDLEVGGVIYGDGSGITGIASYTGWTYSIGGTAEDVIDSGETLNLVAGTGFTITSTDENELNFALGGDVSLLGQSIESGEITDGTIATGDIADNTITTGNLSSTLTFADGDLLDLSAIAHDDAAGQGLILPQNTAFTSPNAGEGYIAWDTDDNQLQVFDGTSWTPITAGTSLWTEAAGVLYPTTTSNDLAIGGTDSTSPIYFDAATGNANFEGQLTLGSSAITINTTTGYLDVDALQLASSDGTGDTSSGSGLEADSANNTIGLLQGCLDGEILKWDNSLAIWQCSTDAGSGGVGIINVQTNETPIGTNVDTLDFSTDFALTASPSNEINVSIADDILNFSELSDALTLDAATTITNGLAGNLTIDLTSTGDFVIADGGTAFATFTDGGNLSLTGAITSGTWQGTAIGTQYGGTGLDASAATNGQLLVGNGAGFTLATLTAGNAIDITNASGSITIDHEDTSSQASVNNSATTVIQDVTLDAYGHLTGLTSVDLASSFDNYQSWNLDVNDAGNDAITSGSVLNVNDGSGISISYTAASNTLSIAATDTSATNELQNLFSTFAVSGQSDVVADANSDTLTLAAGSNVTITTDDTTDTITIAATDTNTTYTAGNDLDLTGTQFDIESTLDFVSTINLAGTGTLNGLDAVDATTEDTIEALIFDADAETITGVWTVADDTNLQVGSGGDVAIAWNNTDSLISLNTAGTAAANTDYGIFTFASDTGNAGMTADQEIFEIGKGATDDSSASFVELLALDEDGDLRITGNATIAGLTTDGVVTVSSGLLSSQAQLGAAQGGTGLDTSTASNGQLLIGNGAGFSLATLTAGNAIDITNGSGSITIDHEDTSAQASVNNSGTTVIQDVTLDTYGHLTGLVSVDMATALSGTFDNYQSWNIDVNNSGNDAITTGAVLNVNDGSGITMTYTAASNTLSIAAVDTSATNELQNLFSTIAVSGQSDVVADANSDTLTLAAGSNVTITTNAAGDVVTIAASDANTTYTAGNDLDLTGTQFDIESQLDFVQTITRDGGNLTLSTTTSGDIIVDSIADISFSDANQTSPITLSADDDGFESGDTGIIDAVNSAYLAATGGGGGLWSLTSGVIYPTVTTQDLAIGGTDSTAPFFVDAATGNTTSEGQFITSVTTGTAPFVVSSTTLVSNLNADLLDGQQGSYYLNASNINAGTLGTDYFSAYSDLTAEGYLDNSAGTDLLTRDQSDARYLSFRTFDTESGTDPVADLFNDTITITGGTDISVTGDSSTDSIEIAFTGSYDNYGSWILRGDSGSDVNVTSGYIVDFAGGAGITTTVSANTLTIAASDSSATNELQNLFDTIAVSGQSDVDADSTTDTLTLAAGSNVTITTNATSDTITIAATDTNTTYTAGNDLDLNGFQFDIEDTLDFVSTINLAGTGTLNGLDAVDATTENTIEALIFDADAETITGIWTVADDTNLQLGTGGDVAVQWNNTDSLLSLNTTGTASANTDYGIYTFASDTANAGITADQEIFEIGKGGADDSVATYTELFAIDEDGDMRIAGNATIAGLTTSGVVTVSSGILSSEAQLGVSRGGTGLDSSAASNGQLLIGNGTGFTLATLTAGNAIDITNGAGTITIDHEDTSTQASVDNSSTTVIQDVTLDTYGHISGLTSVDLSSSFDNYQSWNIDVNDAGNDAITSGAVLNVNDGSGITMTYTAASNTLSIAAVDASTTNELQNLFSTFAVSGQNNVVADSNTDTLTLAAGSNVTITTNDTTDTITIAATDTNTTYAAGNDLDLNGTTFDIEDTLDFVSTINLAGTGTLNGLDAVDATTENTIEALIFDADAETITGVWTVADNTNLQLGTGADIGIQWNDTDSLLSFSTADTAASDVDYGLFTFATDTANAGMTANQEVFEIGKGGADDSTTNYVELFAIDEDGDMRIAGNATIAGLSSGVVYSNSGLLSSEAQLSTSRGGTGVDGSSASNGQLLIGNGTGFTLATLTAGNAIDITNGAGSITIDHEDTTSQASVDNSGTNFIQDISLDNYGHLTAITTVDVATALSGTFDNYQSWNIDVNDGGNDAITSGAALNVDDGAGIDLTYTAASNTLSIAATDTSATNELQNLFSTINAPSGTDPVADANSDTLNLAVTGTNLTVTGDSSNDTITFDIDESVLAGVGLAANGSALDFASTELNDLTWGTGAAATITWSTALSGATDPSIAFANNTITLTAGTLTASGDVLAQGGDLTLGQNGTDGTITIYNELGATDYSVVFQTSGSQTETTTYTLPANNGDASQVLVTDGSGVLTWQDVTGVGGAGDITSVLAGTGLTDGGTTGDVTLNVAGGLGIIANADDVAIDLLDSSDGIGSTSSRSGLEFGGTGDDELTLLQGCADTEVLAWDDTNSIWECAEIAGVGGVGDITAVGNITSGAAFTETAGNDGNSLFFEGTTSDGNELELVAADVANDTTTVTLPAITGTLASLSGAQTFDGVKTIADDVNFQFGTSGEINFQYNETDDIFSAATALTASANTDYGIYTFSADTANAGLTADQEIFEIGKGGADDSDATYTELLALDEDGDMRIAGNATIAGLSNGAVYSNSGLLTAEAQLSTSRGGTGLDGSSASNGQLLIGNGTGFSLATLTAGNAIDIINGAGTITIDHEDTSTQASVNNSGTTVIQDVTLDTYGHLTGLVSVDMATALAGTFDNYQSWNIDVNDAGNDAITSGAVLNVNDGSGITMTYTAASNTLSIAATDTSATNELQNLFSTFAVSGQNNVVADSNTDTLTLAAGSNVTITTNDGTDTITIAATDTNTTYTAGNDIDFNGTQIDLEPTLDFVSTINLTGTGTLNGLDAVDATTEDTIEALIFDADAESITGVWTVADDTNFQLGTGNDVAVAWNNTDSLLSLTTAGTASANTDYGIYTFAADTANAGMTADQEVFEIGKGGADDSVATYTELFAIDEDGDMRIAGNATIAGLSSGVVYSNSGLLSSEAQLSTSRGGTGLDGSSASNGQLLIGNGAGFSLATLTAGNAIDITNGAGTITIDHEDTSTQASVNNSGTTVIQDVTLDTYGHISGLTSVDLSSSFDNYQSWNIDVNDGGNDAIASGAVLNVDDGAGIDLTYTAGTNTLSIAAVDTSATNELQNLFSTFAVSGQNNVVADSNTDTLTLAAGSNITITTNDGTDTITIAATDTNTTYTAGNDIDFNGTQIDLEPTLDFVSTINLTGTGTLNGLDAVDATTENTIEALIFDTDAETITGVWTVADDTNFQLGTGSDVAVQWNNTDSLLSLNTAGTASADVDYGIYTFAADTANAGMTADQEIFEIGKGGADDSVATYSELFAIDEDGDMTIAGNATIAGLSSGVVYSNSGLLSSEAQLSVSRGGTGVDGSSASNGQLLIGNGTGFSLATLTAGNAIDITNGAGTITIDHEDTSTQASSDNSSTTVIQDVTLDTYGHITGLATVDLSSSFDNYASWNIDVNDGGNDAITSGAVLNVNDGSGITMTYTAASNTLSIAATDTSATNELQNLFDTFAVSGQSDVDADSTTDTLTLAAGSNVTITTNATTDTITIAATDTNTTYTAGNDIDFSGTQIDLEPTLDFVSTINLTGTGTLNGLDSVDATGENTIEALIFDADAETITGVWTIADDTNLQLGTGGDVAAQWNNTDSLLSLNTAGTASANTDYGIYTFAADTANAGMTADQEIFEIGKGGADDSVATYTELFAIDEDGDMRIAGNATIAGLSSGVVYSNSGLLSSETQLSASRGGTGLDASAASNGQLLIGNGAGFSLATLTAGNAIDITNGAGTITIDHEDTSTQASVDNSATTVIQDVTLDTYGHISGLTSVDLSSSFDNYQSWDIDVNDAGDDAITSGATLNVDDGAGIDLTYTAASNTLSIAATDTSATNELQNLFSTFAVSGQNNVVADSNTDTLTLAAGSNVTITTNDGTDTITIAATDTNTTYTAGNDLDLTGTVFSLETTLDFVDTINLAGTGTLNGLDAVDATTENTIEALIFDADAETISGVWTVADNVNFRIGTGGDLTFVHDGTNTTITSATGDLIVDNTLATGSSIFRLGTDTSATDFQVQNNSTTSLFSVNGAGTVNIAGLTTDGYVTSTSGNLSSVASIPWGDISSQPNIVSSVDGVTNDEGDIDLIGGTDISITPNDGANTITIAFTGTYDNYGNWVLRGDSGSDVNVTSGYIVDFAGGAGITTTVSANTLTIAAADSSATNELQNLFSTFAVSGQDSVVADSNTDTLTLAAGSNVTITTDDDNDTITIAATDTNTTYTAGNDLDLTGTVFSLETTLDFVDTINLAGTGTLNGLDAVDATTENTIEALIFDADAETITGVWTVADDTNFQLGTGSDVAVQWNNTDSLLSLTTAGTASANTDYGIYTFAVDTGNAGMTADQEVFEIGKGGADDSVATYTELFAIDEDGDMRIAGNATIAGLSSGAVYSNSGLLSSEAQLSTSRGGTGVDASAASNGQLLIGNGAGFTLAALTAGNAIDITNGAGTITIDHEDTSTQASIDNSTTTVIQDITLDTYGHLTGATSVDMATALASTFDNYQSWNIDVNDGGNDAITSGAVLNVDDGEGIDLTYTAASNTLSIAAVDTSASNELQNLFSTFAVSGQNSVVADGNTDTLTLAAGSNVTITTDETTDTITIAATDSNTTYTAGNDLDLTGTVFSLETTLDFVDTINLAGTGTLNGLDAVDATGENTIEALIFDADAESITGVWTVADNVNFRIGTGGDLTLAHDGTNTTLTSATGDLIVDNTLATGSSIFRLGTDTSATDFQIQNNTTTALFTVNGAGTVNIAGLTTDGYVTTTSGDLGSVASIPWNDISSQPTILSSLDGVTNDEGNIDLVAGTDISITPNDGANTITIAFSGTYEDPLTFQNGLTRTSDTVELGGALTEATEITLSTFEMAFNLDNTGDFVIEDNGTAFATFTDDGTITLGKSAAASTVNIGTGTGIDTINIGTGGTAADAITLGNTGVATTFDFSSGAATVDALDLAFNSVTTANGIDLSLNALTSGNGLYLNSTSGSTFAGNLALIEWAPASAATASGDLFQVNIGANGTTTGNLFSITDNGSVLFSVNESQVTSNLPAQFTAAGDVTFAYDILMSNQTASYIKSLGPITVEAGESFENNDLTLKTYGTGDLVAEIGGNLVIGSADPAIVFDTTTATDTDFWAGVTEDAGSDEDDSFQIGKGTTLGSSALFTLNNSGNLQLGSNGFDGSLTLYNELGGTDQTVTIQPSASQEAANITYTLPVNDGTDNYVLTTDGSGVLAWESVTGAGGGDISSVVAGTGLTDGGTTGDVTLNVAGGLGIIANADDVAIDLLDSNDGTGVASSQSGLEFGGAGSDELGLLQGCADAEVLAWDDTNTVWECTEIAGVGGVGDITAVGDVTNGAAFTETASADGNTLYFEGSTSDTNELRLVAADVANDTTTVTLPAITGTLASLAGTQTFTGAKTFDDLTIADTNIALSGASTTLTSTGAFTLTPGGAVILGDGGDTFAINSSDWDISDTGALTGVSFDANGTGNSISNIESADISDNTLTVSDLAATLTFADDDLIDLSAINMSDAAEGLILPQNGTACSSATAEGQICWDSTADTLYVGDGTSAVAISSAATGDLTDIVAGDYIDITNATGPSPEIDVDLTEIETATFGGGDGSENTFTWTFATGTTDPTISFADNAMTLTAGTVNISGNADVSGTLTAGTTNAFTVASTGAITTVTDETINGIDINAGAISDVSSITATTGNFTTVDLGTNTITDGNFNGNWAFNSGNLSGIGTLDATGAITAATAETINGVDINAGTVSDVVNLTINTGGDLTIGAIGLNDAGTDEDTSGASLIGTFDEFGNSASTNVQDVLDDLDAAITTLSGGGYTGWNLDVDDAGNDAIGSGETVNIDAGSNITLTYTAATNTLSIAATDTNTTYTAGNDLDLTGTVFSLETTLDTVDTINLAGTGTLNGLDSVDATGENTIEALIFDADAETISGVWTVADNVNFQIGTGGDLTLVHDGTNTTLTSATGDLIIDNTLATGSSIVRFGTDTNATDFQIQNNSTTALFTINGAGEMIFGGDTIDELVGAGLQITNGDLNVVLGTTIETGEVTDNTLTTSDLAATLTFADGDFLDLASIVHDDSALQGIRLPQAASFTNLVSGEGFLAWDTDDNALSVFNGTSWANITSNTGDVTDVNEGFGIDITDSTGPAPTVALAPEELETVTWGDGTDNVVWTFDGDGANDPFIGAGQGAFVISNLSDAFRLSDGSATIFQIDLSTGEPILSGPETNRVIVDNRLDVLGTFAVKDATDTNDILTVNTGASSSGTVLSLTTANTSVTTGKAFDLAADEITSGTAFDISADGLTSGKALNIASTSTALTAASNAGSLLNLDWSPTGVTNATGDLFRLNIGSNGRIGNILNITDSNNTVFSVSESQITSALPHQFTAAGDVSVAYDLVLTNQTASYIKSSGPLYIEAGENFENNNLNMKTYGTGDFVFDNDGTTIASINDDGTIYAGSFTSSGTAALCWDNSGGSTINDCSGSPVADYAEIYPTEPDVDYGEIVVIGANTTTIDVVETDKNGNQLPATQKSISKLARATSPGQNTILGITTQNYSDFTSTGHNVVNENDNPKAVALVGRVKVFVDPSSPTIQPGDFLTSSAIAGKAQKANGSGMVVGSALEAWDAASGKQTVMVYVNPFYYYEAVAEANDPMDPTSDPLATEQTGLEQYITVDENGVETFNIDKVVATDLTVLGESILGDTTITGDLQIGTIAIDSLNSSIDAIGVLKIQEKALGNIEIMGGKVTIDTDGNITANELTVEKLKVAGASAGTETLTSGTKKIVIESDQVSADSLIFVTAQTAIAYPLAVTEKIDGVSFTVELPAVISKDVIFDWFIVDKVQ